MSGSNGNDRLRLSPSFSNRETEDLVRWLIVNLTGVGIQELLRQAPLIDLDTPTKDLSKDLRSIFTRILPPEIHHDWLKQINWVEVAAYLMQVQEKIA